MAKSFGEALMKGEPMDVPTVICLPGQEAEVLNRVTEFGKKKAVLRTYVDEEYEDDEIEVDERYDFVKGPYHEDNENFVQVVGSNQAVLEVEP